MLIERVGILRVNELILKVTITKFFTGERKLINKNLRLLGIKRIETDFNLAFTDYDLAFTADDLPLIPEGCYPLFVDMVPMNKSNKNFKLVESPVQLNHY